MLPPPLKPEEEQALLARLGAGDESARQPLIERNLRLVVYIARRFENTGINLEDLISIGTIGLIKAVSTFRADKNIKLATYSSRCIENEILMYIRKISGQKTEVSLDEPINTDWDGNELLLSDVLGTEQDTVMAVAVNTARWKNICRLSISSIYSGTANASGNGLLRSVPIPPQWWTQFLQATKWSSRATEPVWRC